MADPKSQPERFGPVYEPALAKSLKSRDWAVGLEGEFSCDNAWNLLIASYLAYASEDMALTALNDHDFRGDVVWVENDNDAAFVASDGEHAIVCARGSDDLHDWWDNLHVGLVDDSMGRVHGGVTTAIERLWDGLNGDGLELAKQAKHIWLTGHSRGALIMTLVAARWREFGIEIGGLYTFGSPRIGDENFKLNLERALAGRIHRVQNEGDWMSEMPPNPPYDHVHVGQLTRINQPSDGAKDGATPEEKESLLKQLLSDGLDGLKGRILGRHVPRAYIEGMRAFCGE